MKKYAELAICEHSQKRMARGTKKKVVTMSATMIKQLNKRRDWCMKLIGLRSCFVFDIVTIIEMLKKNDAGYISNNSLVKIIAIASLQKVNSPAIDPLLVFILAVMINFYSQFR